MVEYKKPKLDVAPKRFSNNLLINFSRLNLSPYQEGEKRSFCIFREKSFYLFRSIVASPLLLPPYEGGRLKGGLPPYQGGDKKKNFPFYQGEDRGVFFLTKRGE